MIYSVKTRGSYGFSSVPRLIYAHNSTKSHICVHSRVPRRREMERNYWEDIALSYLLAWIQFLQTNNYKFYKISEAAYNANYQ